MSGGKDATILTVEDLMKVNPNWDYNKLRVMDLGTGDGKTLQMLHDKFKIPYENMAGVTAEDMQGV